FRRALDEAGLGHCTAYVDYAAHRYEDGYAAASRLLDSQPQLTAVFAASDEFAMGVISCARDRGIAVPERLSVIGFDDIRMAHMFIPRLTTVMQPVYDIGVRAVQKLHELITTGEVGVMRERLP